MTYKKAPIILLCGSIALLALLFPRHDGRVPDSLAEVVEQAELQGLYWRSDAADGSLQYRLVVSDRPLDFERVNNLRFGMPFDSCWDGIVAISYPSRAWAIEFRLCEPSRSARWGKMFVFGDPAIIERLTGQGVPATRRGTRLVVSFLP